MPIDVGSELQPAVGLTSDWQLQRARRKKLQTAVYK